MYDEDLKKVGLAGLATSVTSSLSKHSKARKSALKAVVPVKIKYLERGVCVQSRTASPDQYQSFKNSQRSTRHRDGYSDSFLLGVRF